MRVAWLSAERIGDIFFQVTQVLKRTRFFEINFIKLVCKVGAARLWLSTHIYFLCFIFCGNCASSLAAAKWKGAAGSQILQQ